MFNVPYENAMHWEYTLQTNPIWFVDRSLSQVRGEHQPMHAGLARAWFEQLQPVNIHLELIVKKMLVRYPSFLGQLRDFVSKV